MVVLLKLTITPAVIVVASLLARRFGPSFAGWLIGFPFTSAPVSIFLAVEQGAAFAASAATGSVLSAAADVVFALVFMRTAAAGWPLALLTSALAFAGAALVLATVVHDHLLAAAITLGMLLIAPRLASVEPDHSPVDTHPPKWDLPSRALVATGLVLGITAIAPLVGPIASGVISGLPLYASVLGVFAHQTAGARSSAAVMRGLLAGLYGFATFFAVVGFTVQPLGPLPAFVLALVSILGVQVISLASLRR